MVPNVIRIYYDQSVHCEVEKTVQRISDNYWFPFVRNKVQKHIENCLTCLMANTSVNVKEGELQLQDTPSIPLHIVHADHFGPLMESINNFKHIWF